MSESNNDTLRKHARYLREKGRADGTVVPGSKERRVWISPEKCNEIAEDIEKATEPEPTAFERAHPGYLRVLREASR